jgi:hypothetical protein
MKKIISVYIIFAFLLTSFIGCGKLKNSPVSGLNQPEAPALPKANNQSDTSASSEADDWFNVEAPVFGAFVPKPKKDDGLVNLVGCVATAFIGVGVIFCFLYYD